MLKDDFTLEAAHTIRFPPQTHTTNPQFHAFPMTFVAPGPSFVLSNIDFPAVASSQNDPFFTPKNDI